VSKSHGLQTVTAGVLPLRVAVSTITLAIATSLLAACGWQPFRTSTTIGFWFEDGACTLPPDAATTLGGRLTDQEIRSLQQISHAELERAFAGLRVTLTRRHDAFWRVQVRQTLEERGALPSTGRTLPLGPLGGLSEVSFTLVALKAIQYAPSGSSRQTAIEGIGRGIGRVAVHELVHQIVGTAEGHDRDQNSYEYPSPDRASQYYGDLHWANAWRGLQQRIGK
jgi:hypothetical protein